MKSKKTKAQKKFSLIFFYILIIYVTLTLLFKLYNWIDIGLNGKVVDWFNSNYMTTIEYTEDSMPKDVKIYVRQPIWYKVKQICMTALCTSAVLCITVTFSVSHLYSAQKVRWAKEDINEMFKTYMIDNKDVPNIFIEENAELFAQMTEIKSVILQNQQLLKDEAARKNDLIVYLAHDMKTPLTSVIGYLSLLQEIPDMPDEQRCRYINITLDKSLRLEKLINEFFDITRYNLQSIVLEKEHIDLYYMLIQMIDEFYPIFNSHGNTVKFTAAENLSVYGDSEKLARVFNNILKNAVAYSYPDTEIQVLADTDDDTNSVNIYFCSKGRTIPGHKLDAIFEKFFRLDESRSTNTGGAGLGLAIAKEIIELHGGTITATSENELTTFHIRLNDASALQEPAVK